MIEIIHVSDLHFGKSGAQDAKAALLLEKIAARFAFTPGGGCFLCVTGDITDHGEQDEYERAGRELARFAGQVFVTPGNHDYGSILGTAYSKRKAKYFDVGFASPLGFRHPYAEKKKVFWQELRDESEVNGLLVIGLNSCARVGFLDLAQGNVGSDQRHHLGTLLGDALPEMPKLLFLHHIPHRDAKWPAVMTLRDHKELMAVVGDRIDVLAFGHQGSELGVAGGSEARLVQAERRPMAVRRATPAGTGAAWLLDADNSVQEQACYRIVVDGGRLKKPTVTPL